MTPAPLALASVRHTLKKIAHAGDGERLRHLLHGRELPTLGSGEEPAMQIIQAWSSLPTTPGLRMASGDWVPTRPSDGWSGSRRKMGRKPAGRPSPMLSESRRPRRSPGRMTSLLSTTSCCWCPGCPETPRSSRPYTNIIPAGSPGPFSPLVPGVAPLQLRRALCNQQTDTRLKDYWLSLLKEPDADSPWDTVRRSELLEAWRGILWLPRPSDSGPPLDLAAMDTGLRLLAGTTAGHREAATILRTALRRMVDAIPLDPATWVELIAPFWSDWPELLRDLAVEHWPALEPRPLAVLPRLPADLAELWEAFDADTRGDILGALNSGDSEAGRRLVNNLVFSPPRMSGLSPQEVGRRIIDLGHVLWPTAEAQPPVEALYDDRDWQKERERTKGGTKGIDRHAALESVNRGLAAVEQCLRQGDETRARRFLDGLVENQSAQGLPDTDVHVAKTLSKAAVLARDTGYLEWAEQLQRDACRRNQQDPVAANGLAEVLKARGELEAAEQQYRANIARWPNDGVAHHGLANVLRKQQRHAEALQLLPNPLRPVTARDLYDLHLRGMILLELGRWDEAQVRTLQSRLDADVVRMDFTTRAALRKLEAAYCLKGRAGICEPDEAAYRAVIDAEIEMEQAA